MIVQLQDIFLLNQSLLDGRAEGGGIVLEVGGQTFQIPTSAQAATALANFIQEMSQAQARARAQQAPRSRGPGPTTAQARAPRPETRADARASTQQAAWRQPAQEDLDEVPEDGTTYDTEGVDGDLDQEPQDTYPEEPEPAPVQPEIPRPPPGTRAGSAVGRILRRTPQEAAPERQDTSTEDTPTPAPRPPRVRGLLGEDAGVRTAFPARK